VNEFAESSLGQSTDAKLKPIDMKYKWAGGNGDHAVDQRKTHALGKKDKEESIQVDLGTKAILAQGYDAMIVSLEAENKQNISDAGGLEAWNSLSAAGQVSHDVVMMKSLFPHDQRL
jgi:hypothetical protein